MPSVSLDEAQKRDWDVVVVGTGMGGATLGLALARAGKAVLFVEKGRDLVAPGTHALRGTPSRSRRRLTVARPRSSDATCSRAADGSRRSSSTRRVAERCFPSWAAAREDPRASTEWCSSASSRPTSSRAASTKTPARARLPEAWPVSFDELRPWYEAAERLYRVRGSADPLRPGQDGALLPPTPVGAATGLLLDRLTSRGLHPYRLHLACDAVAGCQACQGYLCPSACKNDADRIALRPAIAQHDAGLLSDCEAVGLDADRARVKSVVCEQAGRRGSVRGRVIVLAAGALATPVLLLRSRSADWPTGLGQRLRCRRPKPDAPRHRPLAARAVRRGSTPAPTPRRSASAISTRAAPGSSGASSRLARRLRSST